MENEEEPINDLQKMSIELDTILENSSGATQEFLHKLKDSYRMLSLQALENKQHTLSARTDGLARHIEEMLNSREKKFPVN